jgi:hypothetical protein
MTDEILKTIAIHLSTAGVANVTKYQALQDADTQDTAYTAIVLNIISDSGEGTKDTTGDEDKEYNLRVDIYCTDVANKDTLYTALVTNIKTISNYMVQYDTKADMYDDDTNHYHQVIDYKLWLR